MGLLASVLGAPLPTCAWCAWPCCHAVAQDGCLVDGPSALSPWAQLLTSCPSSQPLLPLACARPWLHHPFSPHILSLPPHRYPPFVHVLKVHPSSPFEVNLNSVWSGMGLMENNLLNAWVELGGSIGAWDGG